VSAIGLCPLAFGLQYASEIAGETRRWPLFNETLLNSNQVVENATEPSRLVTSLLIRGFADYTGMREENMTDSRSRLKAAIAVNALVVVLEVWAMWFGIGRHGLAGNFVFYTECSNLMGGIVCALCLVAEVRVLRAGQEGISLSRNLRWAKYAASCCLIMTLFVVVAILAPMLNSIGQPGYYLMFAEGAKSVTHLAAPLLVTGSYIAFEADRDMTLRQSLVGFIPTLVYAAVAYPCNIARLWDGPYPFFQVWNMPVWQSILWLVALFFLAFGLCQIPRLLSRRIAK